MERLSLNFLKRRTREISHCRRNEIDRCCFGDEKNFETQRLAHSRYHREKKKTRTTIEWIFSLSFVHTLATNRRETCEKMEWNEKTWQGLIQRAQDSRGENYRGVSRRNESDCADLADKIADRIVNQM